MTAPSEKLRGGPRREGPEHGRSRSIMESLMLDIMYDLPEREPGQTYTITEQVVRGETSLFGPD